MTKTKVIQFNKTDRRILTERLENLFNQIQFDRKFFHKHLAADMRITNINDRDRIFRTELKACEILLFKLGSKLFQDENKRPSIRKTFTVKTDISRFLQN